VSLQRFNITQTINAAQAQKRAERERECKGNESKNDSERAALQESA